MLEQNKGHDQLLFYRRPLRRPLQCLAKRPSHCEPL
ncbi:hypothetical protein ACP4OV_021794 [Aristida adscensionis]